MVAESSSSRSLEYTPTWVVAVVCSIIVAISFFAERGLHRLGKFLKHKKEIPLYDALEKLKEELMILGFISLILAVSQGLISRMCIPSHLADYMLPCKLSTASSENEHYSYFLHQTTTLNNNWPRRHLLSGDSAASDHCTRKGKVPLLSMEALHQLHIFIFVLAAVHVFFCATTMLLAGAKIHMWGQWENSLKLALQSKNVPEIRHHHYEFFKRRAIIGHYRKLPGVRWVRSFFKQFYGSVTKEDYITLRSGFIREHCPTVLDFDFHKYMMRTRRHDFRKIVGITWYLWLFVVVFLLLNIEGWHSYFWLSFLPLILLLVVGAKLEHVISDLAREVVEKGELHDGATPAAVKPSDDHFWFHRPTFVLYLLHFILFQNAFETAFFFWVWSSYGFKSCIMEKLIFIIPRLVIGVIVQVLCSYSTLPLYALVTLMGSKFKEGIFEDSTHDLVSGWVGGSKERTARRESSTSGQMQRLEREPFESETMSSIIELSSPNLNQMLSP